MGPYNPRQATHNNKPWLDARLAESGTRLGQQALDTLCRAGCEKSVLDMLFLMLCHPPPELRNEISFRYLDSLESIEAMAGGLTLRDLGQIEARTRKLLKDIRRLKRTPLVEHLAAHNIIASDDLLSESPLANALGIEYTDTRFVGLLNIRDLAKRLSPKKRPDRTRLLTKTYKYIFACTGDWHDKEVADILEVLDPDPNAKDNQESLKTWRHRQKLDKPHTQKSRNL